MEDAKDRCKALLSVKNIIDRVIRIVLRQLKWSKIVLRTKLCLGSPESDCSKRVALVDAVHQKGHAFRISDETPLKGRDTKVTTMNLADDLTD